ncbi:Ca2+-binding RTX toxin-like protein [Actinoplanes lutulentus]|uniref:Hemolysin type calcium-binding protein n=1 Tax=Actinoplanes lutulentus TaxID=1287878 RepID=A0A327ZLP1_9ACTN|nr:calcium-binding protein [Actinoplanes lutulentus]MBB2940952.1 Ca2+-binding RTX toxin-like protein [Actinoplanes lutulentus]RAK43261.1 hemolysin type calcium-binding protein [Actinoplanes lutulentus]
MPYSTPLVIGAVAVVLLTSASPAHAATTRVASVSGTTVTYKAAAGKQNKVVITRSGRTVTIDDRVAITAGKGCKKVKGDKTKVRCTPAKAPTRVKIYTYDRSDSIVNRSDLSMTATGGTAADTVHGGPRGDVLRGETGNDKLYGHGGADTLEGRTGNDLLDGGPGNDRLDGFVGNDRVYGGAGDDEMRSSAVLGGPDNDVFSGGAGVDSVNYFLYTRGIDADADGTSGDDGQSGEKDTIRTDVEGIVGGSGNDRLYGTSRNDHLFGGPGNDRLQGGAGNDSLHGYEGSDVLDGGAGNDQLIGDDPNAGVWPDVIRGGAGRDRVAYGNYTKPLTVDLDGAQRDDGQAGERDTLGADLEDIVGGAGNDRLTGNASANNIRGDLGNDVIRGGAGNDVLDGEDGRDSLYGDAGDDQLSGLDTGPDFPDTADRLDGGVNGTATGDLCDGWANDTFTACERGNLF